MRNRNEKVVKGRVEWRKQNEVKKLHIVMTIVAVFLGVSVAAGAVLAWMQMKGGAVKPKQNVSSAAAQSSAPASSGSESGLPVYPDSFNLMLVNASSSIPSGYSPQLAECSGVPVDERIVPALEKMMDDARAAGCPLKLTAGYVDVQTQKKLYQNEVKRLMTAEKLSQVRAESKAQATVGSGGCSDSQTGMSVVFAAEGQKNSFSATQQYRWLIRNCVEYGFILRYPEDGSSVSGVNTKTGHYTSANRFRYVGTEHALKMRAYSFCLEEYIDYLNSRNAG